jgi:kumamolisin
MYKPSRNVYEIPNSERPHPIDHKLIGPAKDDDLIAVTFLIRSRPDSPPLPDLEYWQRTPIGKRRFLTPEEFAQTYGAAQADLDKVTSFVSTHNMTVLKSHAGKCSVSVRGTVAQMNKAFGIYLNRYEAPLPTRYLHSKRNSKNIPTTTLTYTHYGYDGPVYLPSELADIVTAVIGLDNRIISVPGVGTGDPAGATLLRVTDAANAYSIFFPNDGAAEQTIGIIAMQLVPGTSITQPGGSTITVPNDYGGSYLESDIDQYISSLPSGAQTRPTLIPVSLTVGANTYANNPSLVSSISSTTNFSYSPWSDIFETAGDISISAAISQGATINVYFTENTEQGWLAFLQEVLLPEQGESQPTVVSISYSLYPLSEDTSSVELQLSGMFQKLAAVGIPIFVDAGDWGAGGLRTDGNTHVLYPASDPWITCCGGTVMTINISGSTASITNEVVWSDSFNSSSPFGSSGLFGSTGGGSSSTFPNPPYQTAAGITQITDSNGTTYTGHRFIPDVAGMIGYTGLFLNALSIAFEGTSAVAPLYAGYCAVLQQDFGVPLGFLNPTLYQLGNTTAFNDVKSGNNNSGDSSNPPFFSAGPGWDACTGWGSINGLALLNGIASLMFRQTFYFQVDKSTYGFDEVKNTSTYPNAFWLALEGFTPNNVPNTQKPTVTLAWSQPSPSNPSLTGVSITANDLLYEIPNQPNTPQRIIFPCTVSFDPTTK